MKLKLFLLIITAYFLILSAGCTVQEDSAIQTPTPTVVQTEIITEGYTDVSPSKAKEMISDEKVVVVDVSPVWSSGHLPGAINMPLSAINDEIKYLSSDNDYLIYCHSDSASIEGAETFVNNGFTPVYRLDGNYRAWTDAGYPVEYPKYINVTAEDAKSMMETDSRLVIVDVSPLYDQGHIPGSISIPLSDIETKIQMQDKSAHYLIYCHSDSASIEGAETFMNSGFNPVYRLEGNFKAWTDAGYPVEI
ncbi:rhodanese-like domain-containing protein [Methanochimaera problematica]|nr:rhodanese-like domain-containing protein [Methanoplanus sp. FWC-SCC4]